MDKILEIYTLPKSNHYELENMNRIIMSNKIDSVIENLPRKKSP
jgi:hypothetical protein